MVSLFMGQLVSSGVPADEKTVRSTAEVYVYDKPPAVADDMPVQQELETDPDPLLGLSPRQVASSWVNGVVAPPEWKGRVDAVTSSFARINEQVGTSGTAAAREANGQVHPNLSYAVGIEPVGDLADDNHKFGNDYFVREERDIQQGADNEMMTVPPGYYHMSQESVIAHGKDNARDAAASGPYAMFLNG